MSRVMGVQAGGRRQASGLMMDGGRYLCVTPGRPPGTLRPVPPLPGGRGQPGRLLLQPGAEAGTAAGGRQWLQPEAAGNEQVEDCGGVIGTACPPTRPTLNTPCSLARRQQAFMAATKQTPLPGTPRTNRTEPHQSPLTSSLQARRDRPPRWAFFVRLLSLNFEPHADMCIYYYLWIA